MRRTSGAFSLIELLIVVAIIALLMTLFLPVYKYFERTSKLAGCKSNLKAIHSVLIAYCANNNGWLPKAEHYYGYRFFGALPADFHEGDDLWAFLPNIKQMKMFGAKPEIFFCPMDRNYGDNEGTRVAPHGNTERLWSSWATPNRRNNQVWVDTGYAMFFYRGYMGDSPHPGNRFTNGRYPIANTSGDPDVPIVADELFYRYSCPWPNLKGGWHHGGGVQLEDGSDPGLFHEESSCHTLFMAGHVILKQWAELEPEGPGFTLSNDCWWMALGY